MIGFFWMVPLNALIAFEHHSSYTWHHKFIGFTIGRNTAIGFLVRVKKTT